MPYNSFRINEGTIYWCFLHRNTTTDGLIITNYASTWDGTTGSAGWSTLDGGVNIGFARSFLVIDSNNIYLCGNFSSIGTINPVTHTGNFNVAKWDGVKWNSLGTLGTTGSIVNDMCYDATNNLLYAVGNFTSIYGISANHVAVFDGTSWSALQGGCDDHVQGCTLDADNNLYVTGLFRRVTNDSSVSDTNGIAKWNYIDQQWESIATGTNSVGWAIVYAPDNNSLYVCGNFSSINGVASTKIVAQYDISSSTWNSFGLDFNLPGDNIAYDLEYTGNGTFYIVGNFDTPGNDVAYYDGSNWNDLGTTGGYTLNPPQTSFVPLHIAVDSNGNCYTDRNSGGTYILKSGETQWNRLDNLTSNIIVGNSPESISGTIGPIDSGITSISYTNSSFNNPITYIINQSVLLEPIVIGDGIPDGFSITPDLPSGLTIDINTGVISGISTKPSSITEYTISVITNRRMRDLTGYSIPRNGNLTTSFYMTILNSSKSGPCLEGNVKILTDQGYIKIKNITMDHQIITHDYRIVKIKNIHKFRYTGTIYKIPKNKFGNSTPFADILISPNHKYMINGKWKLPKKTMSKYIPKSHIILYHIKLPNSSDTMISNGLIVESWGGLK